MSHNNQAFIRIFLTFAWSIAALWLPNKSFAANAGECSWTGKLADWNHYYNGRLGNGEAVRAVFAFDNCKVTGSWIDSLWFDDFKVSGSISKDRSFVATLTDKSNRVMATVRGIFPRADVFGLPTGPLTSDMLLGHLSGGNGYNRQTVELRVSRLWNGSDSEVDATVGITDQRAFDRATLRFWRAIRDHDVSITIECVRYPLQVNIYDPKVGTYRHMIVNNARTLRRDYDEIFNWFRRDEIISHLPRHLIWTSEGRAVRLGESAAVFDPEGKVIGLP